MGLARNCEHSHSKCVGCRSNRSIISIVLVIIIGTFCRGPAATVLCARFYCFSTVTHETFVNLTKVQIDIFCVKLYSGAVLNSYKFSGSLIECWPYLTNSQFRECLCVDETE